MNDVMSALHEELAGGAVITIDGATGTELEARGATMHERGWCSTATRTHPDILREIHADYVRAGARIITANTFSTNLNMLGPAGIADEFESLNRTAVSIAQEARALVDSDKPIAVAGSMSHQIPRYHGRPEPEFIPSPKTARANFRAMAEVLAEAGVDMLLMEMMFDPEMANMAIEAAKDTGLPVWVGYCVREGEEGDVRAYLRPDLSVDEMLEAIPLDGISVAGIMHSKSHVVGRGLEAVRRRWNGPLMVYPDSGYFKRPHWQFEEILPHDEFVSLTQGWIAQGAQIVGGCCGLGLGHIEALRGNLPTHAG